MPNNALQKQLAYCEPARTVRRGGKNMNFWAKLSETTGIEAEQLQKAMYDRNDFNKWIADRYETHSRPAKFVKTSKCWTNRSIDCEGELRLVTVSYALWRWITPCEFELRLVTVSHVLRRWVTACEGELRLVTASYTLWCWVTPCHVQWRVVTVICILERRVTPDGELGLVMTCYFLWWWVTCRHVSLLCVRTYDFTLYLIKWCDAGSVLSLVKSWCTMVVIRKRPISSILYINSAGNPVPSPSSSHL